MDGDGRCGLSGLKSLFSVLYLFETLCVDVLEWKLEFLTPKTRETRY